MERLAEAPWTTLERCRQCGSLWESYDRGARRATVARIREVFSVEVPVFQPTGLGEAAPVRRLHLWLNRDALFRILVETEGGRWEIGQRGALLWMPWTDAVAGTRVGSADAVVVARENWGEPAAAALRLALDSGFDPTQLRALDLAQSVDRSDWDRPWQPSAVGLVDAMLGVGSDPDRRVAAAFAVARRRRVLTDDDIRVAGYRTPPPRAISP